MMCDQRLYGPQIKALSPDHDVIVGDITGQDSMADIAASVLAKAPPRFALAGLSMGGIVAMEVLRQAPERVERLALLDTNPRAEPDQIRARRNPQIAQVRAGALERVMRDAFVPNYIATPGQEEITALCMNMALTLGPDVFARQSTALKNRPDQQDTLSHSSIPTLILCGREDRLCPVEYHELMQELIPHAVLTILDGAGHLPTLEHPTATTAALTQWLEA